MAENLFKILFRGELRDDVRAEQAIAHLTKAFKVDEGKARRLVLDGNTHVFKKDMALEKAERYRSALEKGGLIVHVEPMEATPMSLELEPLESGSFGWSHGAPDSDAHDRCPACGSDRVEGGTCRACGAVQSEQGSAGDRSKQSPSPYATPKSELRPERRPAPALWNPDAAGVWSLLLTPVFGSVLVLKNWRALGENARAETGRTWLIVSLLMLIPTLLIPLTGLVYIILWYFAWQRPQTRYVRECWGKEYPRRGWTTPLLIGVTAVVAVSILWERWISALVISL